MDCSSPAVSPARSCASCEVRMGIPVSEQGVSGFANGLGARTRAEHFRVTVGQAARSAARLNEPSRESDPDEDLDPMFGQGDVSFSIPVRLIGPTAHKVLRQEELHGEPLETPGGLGEGAGPKPWKASAAFSRAFRHGLDDHTRGHVAYVSRNR